MSAPVSRAHGVAEGTEELASGAPGAVRADTSGSRERHVSSSTSTSSEPASASSRTRSPSRSRAIGPPCTDSGVTWIAAGMDPDAPDIRPSVTSATA